MGTISSCRTQEINEWYDKMVLKRQNSCENSVGTVPGKTSLMSSVASDHCLLPSITNYISHESAEETLGTNSLDPGVLVEPLRMRSKLSYFEYLISLLVVDLSLNFSDWLVFKREGTKQWIKYGDK